jgi:hypothetical protein
MRRNQGTLQRLRDLQGRHVSVALADGSRIDDCELVSAGHHGARTLWLYGNRTDLFVPLIDVTDLWEVVPPRLSPAVR